MSPELSPYCRARIHVEYPRDQRQEVESLVAQYGSERHHREPERIRRDVLEWAAGDVAKLRKGFELANQDYRDLIMEVEYEPDPSKSGPWNAKKKPTPWLNEP